MSDIKAKVQEDMKQAMREKAQQRLAAIRLILAAVKQKEVDERITLTDEHMLVILDKLVKQRRESITQFQQAERHDLVAQEQFELDVISEYLPQQLSDSEIDTLVRKAVTETGAANIKDMSKVMAVLKPQLQGRADLGAVSNKIKSMLGA